MSRIEELKQTYLKDADLMASKSRFGYFSILPNPHSGMAPPSDTKIPRDENGRVITQQRNIFSGLTSSGVLRKNFFSFQPSIFQGDPYTDPGKKQRISKLEQSKKLSGKDIYKPIDLIKTPPPQAAYQHIPERPIHKTVKDCIDQNGKVVTSPRNVTTNPGSHIEKLRLKQIKYVADPYQNYVKVQRLEAKKGIQLRGQAPFRSSSPLKQQFYTSRQTYGRSENILIKTEKKQKQNPTAEHQSVFKPSCHKKFDTFSYPQYMAGGQKPKSKGSKAEEGRQKFKVRSSFENSKPSPSISTLKSNILRNLR